MATLWRTRSYMFAFDLCEHFYSPKQDVGNAEDDQLKQWKAQPFTLSGQERLAHSIIYISDLLIEAQESVRPKTVPEAAWRSEINLSIGSPASFADDRQTPRAIFHGWQNRRAFPVTGPSRVADFLRANEETPSTPRDFRHPESKYQRVWRAAQKANCCHSEAPKQ